MEASTDHDSSSPSTGDADGVRDAAVSADVQVEILDARVVIPFDAGASVLQHHNNAARTGLFTDPTMTKAKVALSFGLRASWPIAGPTYAAPLFVDQAIGGKDAVIVATEQNVVYALDANSTTVLWQTPPLAQAVTLIQLQQDFGGNPGCGNIDPIGITGTPFIDLEHRTIYLDALSTPDNGVTKRHLAFAISVDDGRVRPGWPVDIEAALAAAPTPFTSYLENQRGALALVDGVLYIPFGGLAGDCSNYHGFIVGIDVAKPTNVLSWATPAAQGGAWAVAGVSSDGQRMYMTTGNTDTHGADASAWVGGESVIRFSRGPSFSGKATDYFAPSDWPALDEGDLDLGGSAALLTDVPGATPSALAVALGKNGKMYLLDRKNLGGVGGQVAVAQVATNLIIGAGATYRTPTGTYVTFRLANGGPVGCPSGIFGHLATVRIEATNPPTITPVWCSDRTDLAPPSVSASSRAGADSIVWAAGETALYGFDGETGVPVFNGGGPADALQNVHYFQTPIVAKGHVYVAGFDHLYAYGP